MSQIKQCLTEIFDTYGETVPLLEKLLWDKKRNDMLKTSGFYCFKVAIPKLLSTSSFLYVGRTQDLQKRFKQHQHAWLNNYVLCNPKNQYFYCYAFAKNFAGNVGEVQIIENLCWQNREQLGLIPGVVLAGMGHDAN
jgi:hypothetical protein